MNQLFAASALAQFDQAQGSLSGAGVARYQKRYADIKGIFEREDPSLADDTLMYEVYTFAGEGEGGGLLFGLTVLYPLTVMGEYNMTRGHFHQDRAKPEIYLGCGGRGVLLLMDAQGRASAQQICPHSLHYIPGSAAHRIINTGEEPLKVAACWEAAAGHDYQAVEDRPFARWRRGTEGEDI